MINNVETSVQRGQLHGLCYMHAGIVAHYYALWHYSLKNGVKTATPHAMVDMRKHIRERFDTKALHRHVFDDKGGDSRTYLRSLLLHCSILVCCRPEVYGVYLQTYGPALVSGFYVHDDFSSNHSVHHHYGSVTGEYIGMHAMVLVGARMDVTHGWCFLLQNWWNNKQFVEVDEQHLESSGAMVQFIKTPQDSMNTHLFTVEGRWCECDMLDKPERMQGENM
jgi:hypothetical protein